MTETATDTGARRPPPGASEHKEKDDFSVLLQGHRLKIDAAVDADGLVRLKQMLDKYEEILKLLQ
jgi:hypothetical protein